MIIFAGLFDDKKLPHFMADVFDLIHSSWIEKYDLRNHEYEIISLPATELLSCGRFDLFAKLFYIRNRGTRPLLAKRVYLESLHVMVPFGKEWGKEEEKSSFAIHVRAFNDLIDEFRSGDFNPSISIVPIGKDKVLLDGAHRVAALAYYGKDVTVCSFSAVEGLVFPHPFFLESGRITGYVMDLIALEGVRWLKGLNMLISWSGTFQGSVGPKVFYRKDYTLSQKEYSTLRSLAGSPLSGICHSDNGSYHISFVLFIPESGTGNINEADCQVVAGEEAVENPAKLFLTREGRGKWRRGGGALGKISCLIDDFSDRIRTLYRFHLCRLRYRLCYFDNKLWIGFYKAVSPLWKRGTPC